MFVSREREKKDIKERENIDRQSLNSSGGRVSKSYLGLRTQLGEHVAVESFSPPNPTNLDPSSKIAREQGIIGFTDNIFSCCDLFRNV